MFKKLTWSENKKSDENCNYDHCIAETPLGRFLITWKSWKEYPNYTVDETPWGEGIYDGWGTLDDLKDACQKQWEDKLKQCLEN